MKSWSRKIVESSEFGGKRKEGKKTGKRDERDEENEMKWNVI